MRSSGDPFSKSRSRARSKEEAQEFQRDFYNAAFQAGEACPFGEGILQELHWEKRIKMAERFLSPGPRILDLGCGDGTVLRALAPRVERAVGIDISLECIKEAEGRNTSPRVSFLHTSLEEFVSADRFDLVLMYEILEHLYDPSRALEKVRSLLKPDGLLMISTPNFGNLARRLKKIFLPLVDKMGFPAWDEIAREHICEYSLGEVLALLRKNFFEVVKKDGVILLFPFTEISKRLIRNRLFHRLNFYSGSLVPSLAVEIYLIARRTAVSKKTW